MSSFKPESDHIRPTDHQQSDPDSIQMVPFSDIPLASAKPVRIGHLNAKKQNDLVTIRLLATLKEIN